MLRPLLRRTRRAGPCHASLRQRAPTRSLATVVDDIHRDPVELDTVTRLPNGLRVASEALPGSFSGVGVYVEAGSRFEPPALRGVSHIMDRLAFKSTTRSSADAILERVEALGGNIQCASSRESMMYQAATFNSAVPEAVSLLAETIRDPRIGEDEVREQLLTAEYEINEIWQKPELILPELVHTAAFRDNTLGNPLLCPRERLRSISRSTVLAYRDLLYRPERIVIAFAGVDHSEAVRLAERYFGDMEPARRPDEAAAGAREDAGAGATTTADPSFLPPSLQQQQQSCSSAGAAAAVSSALQPSRLLSKVPFFKNLSTSAPRPAAVLSDAHLATPSSTAAHYTGGFLSLPPQPPPLSPTGQAFTHIHIAFEGLPIASPDIYALATLQTLLGGGGSFSAGGPGKGMYSRLYTNVLNQHGWVESCVAFNHSYSDSGLFGISASCSPQRINHMIDVVCGELRGLTASGGWRTLKTQEVDRAKNQLRSSLLMNLESRMVELEDLGRQVQVHGHKIPVAEMCARIAALTVDDLARVANTVLAGDVKNPGVGSGAPTVVLQTAQTEEAEVDVTWDRIQDAIYGWQLGRR